MISTKHKVENNMRENTLSLFWMRKAAEAEDQTAMAKLGYALVTGIDVEQDKAGGVSFLLKAANLGNAEAMFNLGSCYQNGIGLQQDHTEALDWFRKAAELGNVHAMVNLGIGYLVGEGVATDKSCAVVWFQKAADAGNAVALENLAICYAAGIGVEKDEVAAFQLLRLAAGSKGIQKQEIVSRSNALSVEKPYSSYSPEAQVWAFAQSRFINNNWYDEPIFPSDWHDINKDSLQTLILLCKIFEILNNQNNDEELSLIRCSAIRKTSLPFYFAAELFELQFSGRNSSHEEEEILSAVFTENEVTLLDGNSDKLHHLAKQHLNLNHSADWESYLRFFCAYVRGELGPFYLCSDVSDLPIPEKETKNLPDSLLRANFEIESSPETTGGMKWYKFRAILNYSDALFETNLNVFPSGMIEMLDDLPVADNLPILLRRFDGHWRTAPQYSAKNNGEIDSITKHELKEEVYKPYIEVEALRNRDLSSNPNASETQTVTLDSITFSNNALRDKTNNKLNERLLTLKEVIENTEIHVDSHISEHIHRLIDLVNSGSAVNNFNPSRSYQYLSELRDWIGDKSDQIDPELVLLNLTREIFNLFELLNIIQYTDISDIKHFELRKFNFVARRTAPDDLSIDDIENIEPVFAGVATADEIGAFMRAARKKAGMTLAEVAEKMDTSHSVLSKIERGQQLPKWETIGKFSDAIGIPMALSLISK